MKYNPDDYRVPRVKLSGGFMNPLTPHVAKNMNLIERPYWMSPGRWRAIKKSRWNWFDPDNYEKPEVAGVGYNFRLVNAITRPVAAQFIERPSWMNRRRWRAMQKQLLKNGCKGRVRY